MSEQDRKLATYRAKRDFARTPEPSPETAPQLPAWDVPAKPATGDEQAGRGETFVIQEHHARALHWDVRLERDGVLVSWAVPKGLPPLPGVTHLAKQTEDHPLAYASFSGEIPRGEYGGGTVTIWDHGRYQLEKWTAAEVKVVFDGERAQGRYVFIRTGGRDGRDWIVRRMDPNPGFEPLPERVAPMLAVAGELPSGDGWAFEMKWDGVRALLYVDGGRVRVVGRSGKDVTVAYPELREIGLALGSRPALIDGEIVAMGGDGRPSFELLQTRMHVSSPDAARRLAASTPATFLPFDLLHLDGRPLLDRPYDERRDALDALGAEIGLAVPPSFRDVDGASVLAAAREQGLEGVVAKRRTSGYQPGRRSADWVKVPIACRQDVVVGGWEPGEGGRAGRLGALLIGVHDEPGGRLLYAGQVGTGFSQRTLDDLGRQLAALRRDTSPFADPPGVPRPAARNAVWVEPRLVAVVEFRAWTRDGRLRHPSYRGLRDDIAAEAVVRDS